MTLELLHSPADLVSRLLIGLGLASEPDGTGAWPVSVDDEPFSPDNVLTVYNTAGIDAGRIMVDGEAQLFHGFQVRLRATDNQTGWAKLYAIRNALARESRDRTVDADSATYVINSVSRIGPVLSLGIDAGNSSRTLFTLNALLSVRRLT